MSTAHAEVQYCVNQDGKFTCSPVTVAPREEIGDTPTTPVPAGPPVPPQSLTTFAGLVTAVIDGRTLDIDRKGTPVRVRLHGRASGGSPQLLADLALQQQVTVVVYQVDMQGHLVSDVSLSDGRRLAVLLAQSPAAAIGASRNTRSFSEHGSSLAEPPAAAGTSSATPALSSDKPVHVNGYSRKDGTYVQPYTRSLPGTRGRR